MEKQCRKILRKVATIDLNFLPNKNERKKTKIVKKTLSSIHLKEMKLKRKNMELKEWKKIWKENDENIPKKTANNK